MAGPYDNWFNSMDQDTPLPTSPGKDTGGYGDWFNAMDQDTPGDVPPPTTGMGNKNWYGNPAGPEPGSWNILTSLVHGGSLGLADPRTIEALAQREADTFRHNGADEAFIAKMMPQWRAMAAEGVKHAQAEYHAIAPGLDTGAEIAGSTATTAPVVGALTGILGRTLAAVGLNGAARFFTGTAGRVAPRIGAPLEERIAPAMVRGASLGTRGAMQGAETGVAQSQLQPDVPVEKQAIQGAALGTAAEAIPPAFRAVTGREASSLDAAGVAAARKQIAGEYEDIASRAGIHSLSMDPRSGQIDPSRLDVFLQGLPGEMQARRRLTDVMHRESGLSNIESRMAPGATHRNALMHKLGYGGVGIGIGAGLTEPVIEILKDPATWPYILGAAGTAAAMRGARNALVNNPGYRNLILRSRALGLTPAEYLGIGNPALAAGNRLMNYTAPQGVQ